MVQRKGFYEIFFFYFYKIMKQIYTKNEQSNKSKIIISIKDLNKKKL